MVYEILTSMDIFTEEEKALVCSAIWNHTDKSSVHGVLDKSAVIFFEMQSIM